MSRAPLPICLALALAAPAHAATERGTVAVTLTVQPYCAVTVRAPAQSPKAPAPVACAGLAAPKSREQIDKRPAYTVRTVRSRDGPVLAVDF